MYMFSAISEECVGHTPICKSPRGRESQTASKSGCLSKHCKILFQFLLKVVIFAFCTNELKLLLMSCGISLSSKPFNSEK